MDSGRCRGRSMGIINVNGNSIRIGCSGFGCRGHRYGFNGYNGDDHTPTIFCPYTEQYWRFGLYSVLVVVAQPSGFHSEPYGHTKIIPKWPSGQSIDGTLQSRMIRRSTSATRKAKVIFFGGRESHFCMMMRRRRRKMSCTSRTERRCGGLCPGGTTTTTTGRRNQSPY
jgi:hypothetical protein